MNWDDLRYLLAVARAGSLARAAKTLSVDHTTVGRRIEALESDLGVRLFTRTTTGYVLTAEAEKLLPEIQDVERAALGVMRFAHAQQEHIDGVVRITSGETFGGCYLAPRLALLGNAHPSLTLELITGGEVLDLARREADIAVRLFRSTHENLVVRRVGEIAHALYASTAYLAKKPVRGPDDLEHHPILTTAPGSNVPEATWLAKLTRGARPAFVCTLTMGLVEAARVGAGVAVLPRYLGDREPTLRRIPMPDEPREAIWLTVHRDVRDAPRVRLVLDHLGECLRNDRALLAGA